MSGLGWPSVGTVGQPCAMGYIELQSGYSVLSWNAVQVAGHMCASDSRLSCPTRKVRLFDGTAEVCLQALNKAKEDFGKLEAKFKKARDDGVRMTASQAVLESRIATVEEQLEETARVRSNLEDQLAEMQESYMELENEMDELQCVPSA